METKVQYLHHCVAIYSLIMEVATNCSFTFLYKVMQNTLNIEPIKYFKISNVREYGLRSKHSIGDLLPYVMQIWTNTIKRYGEF